MQNLKENWLLLSKMTWGIWDIFTRALESLKIGTLMGFFCPKLKTHELKIYWGVMCHENEKWCKNWRVIDFSIQNWHEQFEKFWFKHAKISNICTLLGCLWPKYIMFDLKKSGELCLMVLNTDTTFEQKMTCAFKNDMRNLGNFRQRSWKSQNLDFWFF